MVPASFAGQTKASVPVLSGLPVNPLHVLYEIEMAIAAKKGKGVLPAESGDPEIVGGDRLAGSPQFDCDIGIVLRGGFVDVEDQRVGEQTGEPSLIGSAVARQRNCVSVFA